MRGKYINFEGIDGAGKGRQIELIRDYFYLKRDIFTTKEPNPLSPAEPAIRQKLLRGSGYLSDDRFDRQMIYLFLANRYDHFYGVGHIMRWLNQGCIVFSDRGTLSTIAYNGNSKKNLKLIYELSKDFPEPDYTFYFDLPVEVAMERIEKRGGEDSFEVEANLQRVQANYASAIAKMDRKKVFIIDASKSIKEVHKEVVRIMERIVLRP